MKNEKAYWPLEVSRIEDNILISCRFSSASAVSRFGGTNPASSINRSQ